MFMKKFVNRNSERTFLEKEYASARSSFVIVYGRRRTGKTALVTEFAKNKPAIYFLATEESEAENRNSFASVVAEYTGNTILANSRIGSWEPVFEFIANHKPDQKTVVIIDEFQYIGKSDHAFISRLQKIWDTVLQNSNIMLILCGSLINMMYDQTLSYSSPLYGRRTGQIKLKQIDFRYYHEFFEGASEKQLIESYAVTGGVPKYIEAFEQYDDIYTAIGQNILSKQSYLYEEPAFLLEKEVKDVGSYFSIIKTIASGKHKPGDIASALELKATNLPKYLNVLIDLDIIKREVPITEQNPEKSKMGLYKITDNFIEFWFKFVYPNKSYIESDYTDVVMKKIRKSFVNNHAAYVYEDICRDYYMRKLAAVSTWEFIPDKIGRWWDRKDTEIDIVALDSNGNDIIFGECKYTNQPMDIDIYYKLMEKTAQVEWKRNNRQEHFVFFCINGYTDRFKELAEKNKNILLY